MVGVVGASGEHDTRVIAIAREQHPAARADDHLLHDLPRPASEPATTSPSRATRDHPGALRAEGCRVAVLGTNAPDTLAGGDAGEIVIGFGGADRMRGEGATTASSGAGRGPPDRRRRGRRRRGPGPQREARVGAVRIRARPRVRGPPRPRPRLRAQSRRCRPVRRRKTSSRPAARAACSAPAPRPRRACACSASASSVNSSTRSPSTSWPRARPPRCARRAGDVGRGDPQLQHLPPDLARDQVGRAARRARSARRP